MENRELDEWIAENVMGWWLVHVPEMPSYWAQPIKGEPKKGLPQSARMCLDWNPTTSFSDAFQVVEKMMEKFPNWFFDLYVYGNNYQGKERAVATFQESAEGYIVYSCVGAETVALAISLAAKVAIGRE